MGLVVWGCGVCCWSWREKRWFSLVVVVAVVEWLEWIGSVMMFYKKISSVTDAILICLYDPFERPHRALRCGCNDDVGWQPTAGGELAGSLLQASKTKAAPPFYVIAARSINVPRAVRLVSGCLPCVPVSDSCTAVCQSLTDLSFHP